MDDETSNLSITIHSESASGRSGSNAQPLATSSQAGSSGEDLMEDTLLGSPVLGSRESTSTITGAMEGVLLECSDTETAPLEPKVDPPPPKPQFKRLSGAARRRKKRLAAAQAAAQAEGGQATGETTPAIPQQDQPTTSTREEPAATTVAQTQPSMAKKRPIPTGNTPQEAKPASKKKKLDFKQAVQKSLQVAVVFSDDPTRKITETEKAHIWRQLVQHIDMMPQSSQMPGPRFDRSGLAQGVYRITCADQTSLEWLKATVLMIDPFEGHGFEVVGLSQLNRMKSVRVWVPGEKSDPKTILSRLAKQNQGLDTSEWRLIHRQENDKGQLLVLGVSEESLEKLRLMRGKAHLELSQVTFELPEQGQRESL